MVKESFCIYFSLIDNFYGVQYVYVKRHQCDFMQNIKYALTYNEKVNSKLS